MDKKDNIIERSGPLDTLSDITTLSRTPADSIILGVGPVPKHNKNSFYIKYLLENKARLKDFLTLTPDELYMNNFYRSPKNFAITYILKSLPELIQDMDKFKEEVSKVTTKTNLQKLNRALREPPKDDRYFTLFKNVFADRYVLDVFIQNLKQEERILNHEDYEEVFKYYTTDNELEPILTLNPYTDPSLDKLSSETISSISEEKLTSLQNSDFTSVLSVVENHETTTNSLSKIITSEDKKSEVFEKNIGSTHEQIRHPGREENMISGRYIIEKSFTTDTLNNSFTLSIEFNDYIRNLLNTSLLSLRLQKQCHFSIENQLTITLNYIEMAEKFLILNNLPLDSYLCVKNNKLLLRHLFLYSINDLLLTLYGNILNENDIDIFNDPLPISTFIEEYYYQQKMIKYTEYALENDYKIKLCYNAVKNSVLTPSENVIEDEGTEPQLISLDLEDSPYKYILDCEILPYQYMDIYLDSNCGKTNHNIESKQGTILINKIKLNEGQVQYFSQFNAIEVFDYNMIYTDFKLLYNDVFIVQKINIIFLINYSFLS